MGFSNEELTEEEIESNKKTDPNTFVESLKKRKKITPGT